MFAVLFKKKIDTIINGCHIVKPSNQTADFPFCDDLVFLDDENQMGIEFNDNYCIRISGFITTDKTSLFRMLDAVNCMAQRACYERIIFADELSADALDMLIAYGFVGDQPLGADINYYLEYTVFN